MEYFAFLRIVVAVSDGKLVFLSPHTSFHLLLNPVISFSHFVLWIVGKPQAHQTVPMTIEKMPTLHAALSATTIKPHRSRSLVLMILIHSVLPHVGE
jgi:hypothetical protein